MGKKRKATSIACLAATAALLLWQRPPAPSAGEPFDGVPFIDSVPSLSVESWTDEVPFIDGEFVDTASTMAINLWVEQE